jgi:hypothetical protein
MKKFLVLLLIASVFGCSESKPVAAPTTAQPSVPGKATGGGMLKEAPPQ